MRSLLLAILGIISILHPPVAQGQFDPNRPWSEGTLCQAIAFTNRDVSFSANSAYAVATLNTPVAYCYAQAFSLMPSPNDPVGPLRPTCTVLNSGIEGMYAGAIAYRFSRWKSVLNPGGVVGASRSVRANVSFSGFLKLGGAIGPGRSAHSLVDVSIITYRVDEAGRYLVENDLSFEGDAKLEWTGTQGMFTVNGEFVLDDFEQVIEPDGVKYVIDINASIPAEMGRSQDEDYFVQTSITVYANVSGPEGGAIQASSEFANTLSVQLESTSTNYTFVPQPAHQLIIVPAGNPDPSSLKLTLTGQPGGQCVLQHSTNLVNWSDILTNASFTGEWQITNILNANVSGLFFRGYQNFPSVPEEILTSGMLDRGVSKTQVISSSLFSTIESSHPIVQIKKVP